MTQMQYDAEDIIGMIVFIFGTSGTLGWVDFSFFGIGLDDVLYTISADGYASQLTVGIFLSILGLGIIIATNDFAWRAYSGFQIWLVIAVVWLVISPPFVPIMKTITFGSDLGGVLAFVTQSMGAGFLSWSG